MSTPTPRVRTRQRPTQSEFRRINAPRVAKLVHMIEVIENSAGSNRAAQAEVEALLAPALEAMSRLTGQRQEQGQALLPGPVPGRDRKDIRAAMRTMQGGKVQEGLSQLHKVVLGWVVPDKV